MSNIVGPDILKANDIEHENIKNEEVHNPNQGYVPTTLIKVVSTTNKMIGCQLEARCTHLRIDFSL